MCPLIKPKPIQYILWSVFLHQYRIVIQWGGKERGSILYSKYAVEHFLKCAEFIINCSTFPVDFTIVHLLLQL